MCRPTSHKHRHINHIYATGNKICRQLQQLNNLGRRTIAIYCTCKITKYITTLSHPILHLRSRPKQAVRQSNLLAPIHAPTNRYKNNNVPEMIDIINKFKICDYL